MKKMLIAYYSWSNGNTKRIAGMLQEKTDADIVRIDTVEPYKGSYMKEFQPLNDSEMEAVRKVQEIFKGMNLIPCTACRYCEAGCPKKIAIPDLFAVMNTKQIYHDWNADYYYSNVHTAQGRKASDCMKCGKCEKACPQHLEIRRLLEDVAMEFEK